MTVYTNGCRACIWFDQCKEEGVCDMHYDICDYYAPRDEDMYDGLMIDNRRYKYREEFFDYLGEMYGDDDL